MLRVIIELWPHGWPDRKRTIGVLDIWNTCTHLERPRRGNYQFALYRKPRKGRPSLKVAARRGEVRDYPRLAYSVWELVRRALNTAYGK